MGYPDRPAAENLGEEFDSPFTPLGRFRFRGHPRVTSPDSIRGFYLRCANAAEAAVEAGYAERSAHNQACRLLQTRRIRARLADIQEENALQACSGLYVMLAKLQNVYERAIEARHFYAAARAVEIQSRLIGLREGRSPLPAFPRPAAVSPPAPAPGAPPPEGDLSDIAPWLTGGRE
jgi:hypothetical protein